MAHATHARLLLNHYVATGAKGDPEALVQDDLRQLSRLPGRLAAIPIARTRARLAALRGDSDRAIELVRVCLDYLDSSLVKQETEHDRYGLGLLLGGEAGAHMVALARKGLRECGISDPDANMRAYVPELLPR